MSHRNWSAQEEHNHSLLVQWLFFCCTYHIFSSFFFSIALRQSISFCASNQIFNSLLNSSWHVVKVNVWACFPHGLWKGVSATIKPGFCISVFMGDTMHPVRVRNFGVVVLQSHSQPTPFHLFFLLLTDVCQTASLRILVAVSPLRHIHTNWRKPPQLKGEPQKLFLSDTFVAAQTFSVDEILVTRLALQRWGKKSHSDHRSVSSDRAEKQCRPKTCRPPPLPLWQL